MRQYVLQGSQMTAFITMDPTHAPPPPQTIQMAVVVVATVPIFDRLPVFAALFHVRGLVRCDQRLSPAARRRGSDDQLGRQLNPL
jgi:hypothetical protein